MHYFAEPSLRPCEFRIIIPILQMRDRRLRVVSVQSRGSHPSDSLWIYYALRHRKEQPRSWESPELATRQILAQSRLN